MATVFLDTNVFLYAIGGDSPYRASCRALLEQAGRGGIAAVTSSEVLQEILYVRARRAGNDDGSRAVQAAAGLVDEVLPVTREDVLQAAHLLAHFPRLGARDAVHAAVMVNAELSLLVSLDRDFDVLDQIKRLSPEQALGLQT